MNNQLNPDPQGGESNMEAKIAICEECGHSRDSHKDYWGGICVGCPCSGFREPQAATEPEGATTQPTPPFICDDPECKDCNLIRKPIVQPEENETHQTDTRRNGGDGDLLLGDLRRTSLDPAASVAQPVPSAGSKPQEEGGAKPWRQELAALNAEVDKEILEEPEEWWRCRGDGISRISAEGLSKLFDAFQEPPASQPVADGGGLPPLDITESDRAATAKWLALVDAQGMDYRLAYALAKDAFHCRSRQMASSQEALRVAGVRLEALCLKMRTTCPCGARELREALIFLSLLSPEGSSR